MGSFGSPTLKMTVLPGGNSWNLQKYVPTLLHCAPASPWPVSWGFGGQRIHFHPWLGHWTFVCWRSHWRGHERDIDMPWCGTSSLGMIIHFNTYFTNGMSCRSMACSIIIYVLIYYVICGMKQGCSQNPGSKSANPVVSFRSYIILYKWNPYRW